jgi:WD40 repeat protein
VLRALLRAAAFLFSIHGVLLLIVYALGFGMPSGGVLDVATERRTLMDYGLGLRFELPVAQAVFSPDRRFYLLTEVLTEPPRVAYRLRALHDPRDELLFSDDSGSVRGLPSWSPDGQRIAYLRQADASSTLVVVQLSDRQIVATYPVAYPIVSSLVWWPDGSKLLLAVLIDGQYDLVTLDLRDGHLTWLTHTPYNETFPLITPDGQTIIFTSSALGTLDIYTMHSDGSMPRPLITGEALYTAHAVSPDGRWLTLNRVSAERGVEGLRFDRWSGALLPAFSALPAAQLGWW